MSSRLYRRVIDELGLCYDVWAEMDVAHDVSFLEIGAAVAPNKLPRVLKEIAQEVAKLRDTPIEPRELEEWRQRWRFQQEFLLDKIPSLNELLGIWVLHHRYRSFEERWESMARWTPEELQAIWQKWLTPERMVLGAVGALSKKRKRQLKESIQTILGEEP
jgi:predicted Zn-dependent peptidase